MIKYKSTIIAFAVFGALLIISTGFIQPISVQANTQENTGNEPENLGQYLRPILEDQTSIELIELINIKINENKPYKYQMDALVNHIVNDGAFEEFTNKLGDTYKATSNLFQNHNQPKMREETINTFNNNENTLIGAFQIKEFERSRSKDVRLLNIIGQRLEKFVILNNILTNLIDKITDRQNLEEEPLTIEVKFDLWYMDIFGYEYRVLKNEKMDIITSFIICFYIAIY